MFISEQTYCVIKTSVYELIECTKYLLRHSFQYVLSSAFDQDCLEEHLEGIESVSEDLSIVQCTLLGTRRECFVFRGH